MEVRFGNRKRIRFSDKKHPKHGIISVVLGVLSIIILLTLCIVSGHAKGRAGMEIGALGLATMVLSIIGFVLAVRCNKEEDIYHVTPAVGSVLNGYRQWQLLFHFHSVRLINHRSSEFLFHNKSVPVLFFGIRRDSG